MAAPTEKEMMAYRRLITTPPPPGSPYALPVTGTERPNRSPVYRHWRFHNSPLLESFNPALHTVHDMFEDAAAKNLNKRCLGWRPWNAVAKAWEARYEWISFAEVAERRKNLGAGLVELHMAIGVLHEKYGVGLWAQNRPEWQITELALFSQSLWPVSLYETLGPETSEYIINHGGLSCVVCSLPHIPTLLRLVPRVPSLKLIVSLDPLDNGEPEGYSKLALLNKTAAHLGVQIFTMRQVEEIGAKSGRPMRPPRADDIITVNYTSGTTGDPKGVVLTHRNGVAALTASMCLEIPQSHDLHISYLPSAHIYGRMADQSSLVQGVPIGYFHGDVTALIDDIKILQPTILLSVPRLFNRIGSALRANTVERDGIVGAFSRHVIESRKASMRLPPGKAHNRYFGLDTIWNRVVTAKTGLQNCRNIVSGSAQLDPEVHEFLRAALGSTFIQGFGMTETYAIGSMQAQDDFTLGSIGPPVPCVELCIESVPEYTYTVNDKPHPRGELLLRGPLIFKEYFKNPEETKKAIEDDGWFHSGDIVEVDNMGRFKIIDRKKNVLKLAQGEYISPERIENVYMASTNLVAMAFVHGSPKEFSLVAVFGIEPATFAPYASKILHRTIVPADHEALKVAANDPQVKKAFLQLLDNIAKKHKFNSYEKVKNCFLDIEPFSVENELLTPTLKLKRPQAARAFQKKIECMYEEVNAEERNKAKL